MSEFARRERTVAAVPIIAMLLRREWLRFLRQPARIVAAIGTGIVLWIVIGGGLSGSVGLLRESADGIGIDYRAYLIPGVMTLVAMFAAVFASLSVIEARREGFLQAALVAPAPRWTIAIGLIGGGASVAMAQVVLLLPLAWIAGLRPGPLGVLAVLVALKTTCIALQGLGLAFAWRCRDSASFHGVMNLVLMPLWLLSDAFFPVDGAGPVLATVIALNPLSWCGSAVRVALVDGAVAWWPLLGAMAFALTTVGLAVATVTRSRRLMMAS